MAKTYRVTVKDDYRWSDAQVGGRVFSKAETATLTAEQMTDEILKSSLLSVVVVGGKAPKAQE